MASSEEAERKSVLDAVQIFVSDRFADAWPDPREFSDAEIERMVTDGEGHLEFEMTLSAQRGESDPEEWYVEATLYFEVSQGEQIEGTTDTYLAYRDSGGEWVVDWHSS